MKYYDSCPTMYCVKCIETDITYAQPEYAARAMGVPTKRLKEVLNTNKTINNFHFTNKPNLMLRGEEIEDNRENIR